MILVVGVAMMAQAAIQNTAAASKPAKAKLICVQTQQIGSRLGGQRVCRTKAEWDQDNRDARNDIESAQRTNTK